jgi:putative ABC transport system permease protein
MRRLKQRRAPLIATLLAVALGAALASACGGLFETALRLDAPPQRLAAADVVVAPTEHAQLAAAEGKPAQPVALSERGVLPAGVLATVRAVPGVTRARLVADLDAIAVSTRDPGAVKARLAGRPVAVLTGDDRGRAERTGVAASRLNLILLASIFGGMALIVMAILLASIIGLTIEQRHRELALLRTIGATPKQVRRLVAAQTMRPAFVAAVAGALAGPALARALFARVQDGGVVPDVLALRQGVLPVLAGALAALIVVRVSVALAARKAGRARMGEALGEVETLPGAVGPIRLGLAALMAVGAVSCGVVTLFMSPTNAAATGGGVALAGALGCALIAPLLTERLAGRLKGVTERLAGLPGELAVANVRARSHRTAALVTPVILVAAIALANVYQQTTQANAARAAYLGDLKAEAVVTGPITPEATDIARQLGPASPLTTSSGWIEHPVDRSHRIDPWPLLGVEPSALKAKAADGSLADLHGFAVALPQGLDSAVGDTIGMVLGDGAHVRLRVVALLDGSSRNRSIILPAALLTAHTTTGRPQQLLVQGDRDRLARALPHLSVRGEDGLAEAFDSGLRVDAWITFVVVGVIVAYAAMSLVNSLVAALGGRRRELTLLRLAGATKRQVRRMLEAEALLIATVGAIAGTAVAVAGLIPLAVATAGSPLPSGPPWVFAAVLLLVAALVLLPTLVVSRTLLRKTQVNDVETN